MKILENIIYVTDLLIYNITIFYYYIKNNFYGSNTENRLGR